ncbi:MAG TPA: NAD-dependent epimerase/dehydratase family protein [Chitinophagales bacterium]|nr:NAD-dependent epimerase/dehydratase family protein [Chitinophagales bacterium]
MRLLLYSLPFPQNNFHLILVTGGTGFLGMQLLRELVKRGEKVRAIKRSGSTSFLEEEFTRQIEWVEGDVLHIPALEEAMSDCEKVYHCAAVVSFLPKDHERIMKVNVEGTANVVNVALEKKIKKLVHVSSVAAIGSSRNDEVVNETTEWEDGKRNSNYAISKFLGEREVWRGIAEGLNAVIVNPSLIIGAGNWNEGPPQFFKKVWEGMPYYTNGGAGVVAINDVVTLMVQLMESEIHGERFIINAEHFTFKDFFSVIADQLKKRRPFINIKPWMMKLLWREEMLKYKLTGISPLVTRETSRIASRWSRFDNSKIISATGFQFTPVKKYLEETAMKFLADL